MTQVSKHPLSPKIENRVYEIFIDSIKRARSSDEVFLFLNDLLSPVEGTMLAKRVAIAFLLIERRYTYKDISKILRVSRGTIAKVNAVLATQGSGYRKIIRGMLRRKAAKQLMSELAEVIRPLPPKGASKADWYRKRRKKRLKRQEPL